LTKAQSEKRKVKSESAKRKRVLTPLIKWQDRVPTCMSSTFNTYSSSSQW